MTLEADVWFPTIIWHTFLTGTDNHWLKTFADGLKAKGSSATNTNYFGWQSESLHPTQDSNLALFSINLDREVRRVCEQVGLPTLKMYNMWFNINPPGAYNTIHNHRDSVISGVYYIDVPDEKAGMIEFYREDDIEYYLPDLPQYNQFTSQKAVYKPEVGKLLLFPSWLKHSVQGNLSDKDRYSLSFNYGVK